MGRTHIRSILTLLALSLSFGCGKKTPPPPGPGEARGSIPDLRGSTVLVLPVQLQSAVPQGIMPDAELAFALGARGEAVDWVFASDVQEVVERSPGVQIQIHNLPVGMFLQAQVNRVGDPLYGNLRRAAALVGADVAIIPVQVSYGADETYIISAAILDIRTGRVFWYGVVEGNPGDQGDPRTLASAMDRLARSVMRLR